MGSLFKIFLFLAVILIAGYYAFVNIPHVKQRVIEAVNPAAKEARLIDEIVESISAVKTDLASDIVTLTEEDAKTARKKNIELLDESERSLAEIARINEFKTSTVGAGIGQASDLISRIFPEDPASTLNRVNEKAGLYKDKAGSEYVCSQSITAP